jgi:hypothetical protein
MMTALMRVLAVAVVGHAGQVGAQPWNMGVPSAHMGFAYAENPPGLVPNTRAKVLSPPPPRQRASALSRL